MKIREWVKLTKDYWIGAFSMYDDLSDGAQFQAMIDSVEWHLANFKDGLGGCGYPRPPTKDAHVIVMEYLKLGGEV